PWRIAAADFPRSAARPRGRARGSGAEVVVIGAGAIGASIAYHLAARGARVQVLERGRDIQHASTSRSGGGGVPPRSRGGNILLSKYSIARLRDFGREIGVDVGLRLVGYLFLVREPATWARYQRDAALQRRYEVPTQLLSPDEAGRFIPGTRVDDLLGATFCDQDGYCDPRALRDGYLARAVERGATVRYGAGV